MAYEAYHDLKSKHCYWTCLYEEGSPEFDDVEGLAVVATKTSGITQTKV